MEVGYCNDTLHLEKLKEKQTQHSALESALKSYGYEVTVLTYISGFYGSTDTDNQKTLHTLDGEFAAADRPTRKIHEHSIICAHNVNKTRRFLENSQNRDSNTRKRQNADPHSHVGCYLLSSIPGCFCSQRFPLWRLTA